jgi:acyl transferase domain-containing protein
LYAATGGSFSVAAGRLSFTYGFKGPAVSIDTACSSALVATHHGMLQAQGLSHMAVLAAGINLMVSETTTAAAQAAGMLSFDGRCKALDAGADGYVRAEACTAFMLAAAPPLLADVQAVFLRATFINQDGRSSSLTAPNGPSQQNVIRGALESACLQPSDIGALEMHGTGEVPLKCYQGARCPTQTYTAALSTSVAVLTLSPSLL